MTALIPGIIASYFVGAIPFGYLAGKVLKGIDIRDHGSGNMGATNVLRNLGTLPGVVVLLLDVAKGVSSVVLIAALVNRFSSLDNPFLVRALCGAAAIVGHDWPLFLHFKGGKGAATGLGVFLSLSPLWTLASLIPFVLIVFWTRHVSLGSLLLAACLPVAMLLAGQSPWYSRLGAFWFLSVLYLHRQNIRRLLHGTESRIGRNAQASRENQ
jgi:glycerol-3-phosphate acyltransferase PlsY